MKEPKYSKCQMYKFVCNDVNIKDCYVGHTCNWIQRKCDHKRSVNNDDRSDYNTKKSVFIRENGGWNNWSMILIEDYPCENKLIASQRERYWIETLGATLNMTIPSRTAKEQKQIYYQENKEYILERCKNYIDNNKEKHLEYQKKYREENKDKIKEYHKQLYQNKNK